MGPVLLLCPNLVCWRIRNSWIWVASSLSPTDAPAVVLHRAPRRGAFLVDVGLGWWGREPSNLVTTPLLPHSVALKATPGSLRNIQSSTHLSDSCWDQSSPVQGFWAYLIGALMSPPAAKLLNFTFSVVVTRDYSHFRKSCLQDE